MIDWQRVDELRDEVGAEDFQEVVDIFLEEVDEVADRLRETPDPGSYEAELHFLKGSALNLGFATLGTICADGEKLAAEDKPDAVDLTAVLSAYEASKAEFLAQLGLTQDAA
ncbi:MAG: Hpt domain-containing protein [Rhodobacter sp.]|nr:Hpt domain-containing protein [Rhodobacter sp.]